MIKTLKSEIIYDGRVIKVYRDEIEQSGKPAVREIVRHGGGACVLAEKGGKFAFVKQYRHALGKDVLEIPAGKRENGEAFEITACRELEEECALKPQKIKKITETKKTATKNPNKIKKRKNKKTSNKATTRKTTTPTTPTPTPHPGGGR